MKSSAILAAVILSTFSAFSYSNELGESAMYVGGGTSKTDKYGYSSGTAMTLGFMKLKNSSETFYGGDISGEGTMYHNGSPERANSLNLLIGKNLANSGNSRFDAAILVGMRGEKSTCPSSYIGYRCYADSDPSVKWGLNYGLVGAWSFNKLLLGIRLTGESKQALIGVKF
jgi:hypothetical protein